jgi:CheY-like chemotaxis protein
MQILVAEDDRDVSTLYRNALERRKHRVVLTSSGDTCLQNYLDNLPPTATMLKSTRTTPKPHGKTNSHSTHSRKAAPSFAVEPSYDVVILDYEIPGMNGMDVAKEILEINPHQRIIFASAYVEEILQESVKRLKQVVELMPKPFSLRNLVETVEDKEAYEELEKLNLDVGRIRNAKPSHELLIDLLERLRRIEKTSLPFDCTLG